MLVAGLCCTSLTNQVHSIQNLALNGKPGLTADGNLNISSAVTVFLFCIIFASGDYDWNIKFSLTLRQEPLVMIYRQVTSVCVCVCVCVSHFFSFIAKFRVQSLALTCKLTMSLEAWTEAHHSGAWTMDHHLCFRRYCSKPPGGLTCVGARLSH